MKRLWRVRNKSTNPDRLILATAEEISEIVLKFRIVRNIQNMKVTLANDIFVDQYGCETMNEVFNCPLSGLAGVTVDAKSYQWNVFDGTHRWEGTKGDRKPPLFLHFGARHIGRSRSKQSEPV